MMATGNHLRGQITNNPEVAYPLDARSLSLLLTIARLTHAPFRELHLSVASQRAILPIIPSIR